MIPLMTLLACLSPEQAESSASSEKGESKDDKDSVAEDISMDIFIGCAEDDLTWCETLMFDASDLISPSGEDVVEWSWEIDGSGYTGDVVKHTFDLEEDEMSFEGTLKIVDAAGEVSIYDIRLDSSIVTIEDTEDSLYDTALFWFGAVSPAERPGADCKQRIVAVSGCLTGGFDMDWVDTPSSLFYDVLDWNGVAPTYQNTQLIVLAGPSWFGALNMDFYLTSNAGEMTIRKNNPKAAPIVRQLSCTPAGPGN